MWVVSGATLFYYFFFTMVFYRFTRPATPLFTIFVTGRKFCIFATHDAVFGSPEMERALRAVWA